MTGFPIATGKTVLSLTSFDPVFKGGKRKVTQHFKLMICPNSLAMARFGQSVGKKICKKAVGRNYMRRYCREWVRLHHGFFSGLDCVLIHRLAFQHDDLPDIRMELQKLIQFAEQCQKSS